MKFHLKVSDEIVVIFPIQNQINFQVQNLKFTNRRPLLAAKNDFLILNRGDINILSNNQQNSIDLEVSIQEINSMPCDGN